MQRGWFQRQNYRFKVSCGPCDWHFTKQICLNDEVRIFNIKFPYLSLVTIKLQWSSLPLIAYMTHTPCKQLQTIEKVTLTACTSQVLISKFLWLLTETSGSVVLACIALQGVRPHRAFCSFSVLKLAPLLVYIFPLVWVWLHSRLNKNHIHDLSILWWNKSDAVKLLTLLYTNS